MGIPKFNSWFHAAHAPAYVRLDGPDGPGTGGADHVYVDMNSVLHSALRQVRLAAAAVVGRISLFARERGLAAEGGPARSALTITTTD